MSLLDLKEDIRTLSEFRANAAEFVGKVRETGRPLVLTRHGRTMVVLLDIAHYQELLERAGDADKKPCLARSAGGSEGLLP